MENTFIFKQQQTGADNNYTPTNGGKFGVG